MHVCSLVSHVDDQSFACSVKQEDKRALCEIWYDCDFPLFFLLPVVTWLSCREILIWSGVCSFCLSSPISLTHSCPFPPISISPTSLFLCQAAGITQMALAQARMLIWEKDACCEFFLLSRGNTSCVSICLILSLLTGIYFLNSGNFSFLPIILALCIDFYLCWIRKAHSQTVSFGLCADFSVVFGRELVVL